MNGNEYILAFADIHDDLIHAASDDTAVRKVFRQYKSRRNKMISALCCCIVIAMVAVGFGSQKWFGKTPAVILNDTTTADHLPTEPNETQPPVTQPGVIPQETESLSSATSQSPHETPSVSQEQPASTVQTPSVGNVEPSTKATEPLTTQPPASPDDSVIWGDGSGTSVSSIETWNGKQIGYELWEVLQKDTTGRTIAIVASPRINDQFVYNGKTIADYEAEAYYERSVLPDKLQQLLKEGEVLKYGEALYTTGTPDGEIWARDLYESKIAYYGTELLSKYIVNGNFLADQVAADLALAQNATAAQNAYDEAVSAFYSQTVAAAVSAFSAKGLSCSVTGHGILFFASADRFARLTAPDNAEWYYSLAQQNSGDTVRE